MSSRLTVIILGAGDLATGTAHRLYRAGLDLVMTELPEPRAVRRLVCFSECVFRGECEVEGVRAVRVASAAEAAACVRAGERDADPPVPVLVDHDGRALAAIREALAPQVLVDARMAKTNLGTTLADAPVVIGLGPGFEGGVTVHAVVETARGHDLGRVIYRGRALDFTGVPGEVGGFTAERVLRAPEGGVFRTRVGLADRVAAGQLVGEVFPTGGPTGGGPTGGGATGGGATGGGPPLPVRAAITGVVRGLLRDGAPVAKGQKLGDIDPRLDPDAARRISDKARAVAGGVLEAVLCLTSGRRPRQP